ncbi:hypothetical protein BH24ACI4_BH24ACI4_07880 [soil metagenome]
MAVTRSAYIKGGAVLLAALLVMASAPLVAQTAPVNRDARLTAAFLEHVQQYMQVHEKARKMLPDMPTTATASHTDTHSRALGRAIAQTRSRARVGDIFTREIRGYFRQQIARALSGPGGAEVRASIMDENPQGVRFRVNERYPDTVPFASMPPQVLSMLPKLPLELEYRFIGERLILLDVHAHLIVDFIDNALPK